MNAQFLIKDSTVPFSVAISEAASVRQIADRLAIAPISSGADGELSRDQLFGQYAYECCMDSDYPISAAGFAKFSAGTGQDFHAYLTQTLAGHVDAAKTTLESEFSEWDKEYYGDFPLSGAEIAQLNLSAVLEHAVKLAAQEFNPAAYDEVGVSVCSELSAAQSLSRVAEIIGQAVGQPQNEYVYSADELLGQYAYETRMASSNDYPLTQANWAEFKSVAGRPQSLTAYFEDQLSADVEVALEVLAREGLNPASFNAQAALIHAVSLASMTWFE